MQLQAIKRACNFVNQQLHLRIIAQFSDFFVSRQWRNERKEADNFNNKKSTSYLETAALKLKLKRSFQGFFNNYCVRESRFLSILFVHLTIN